MTRDDGFIGQLESYLDDYEGHTPLPETVRDAVRAALPRTRQTGSARGPVRYLTMMSTKAGPILIAAVAAAVLIVAGGAFLFSGRNVGGPASTPNATPVPSAEACARTTANAAGAGGGRLDIDWCATVESGSKTLVSFSMEGPRDWVANWYAGFGTLWLRPSGGGAITFVLHEGRSVDEVVDDIAGRNGYVVDNRSSVTLGGAEGFVFDVGRDPSAATDEVPPLIDDQDLDWTLSTGSRTRVWVVDRDGETIMIAAGEAQTDQLASALRTIDW
ncbi:MAG: hypothetical protein M3295_00170, partial [Chloroflexota bacterium]|nr:hypothetical protein [Chloroflexota bacterium]